MSGIEGVAVPGAGPGAASGTGHDDAFPSNEDRLGAGRSGSSPGSRSRRNQGVPGAPLLPGSVAERCAAIVRRLTDRDRETVRSLARHRVLTTDHLTEAFFPSKKRAWARLSELHRLELVARFQPFRVGWGTESFHFVVGRAGAWLIAAEEGRDAAKATRAWRADRALAIACRRNLPHVVGLAGIWASLAGHERRNPQRARLARWLTEPEAAAWTGGIVHPDAVFEWHVDGTSMEALLEYDRGTEARHVLAGKVAAYERLEQERGATSWLLLAFASVGREASVRSSLSQATVPIATAVLSPTARAHEAVWSPLSSQSGARLPLHRLEEFPKPSAALDRAASSSPRAWRFDRVGRGEEAPFDV